MSRLNTAGLVVHIYNSNQTGSGAYAAWLMAPTYFPRGGYVYSGTVWHAGSDGYWWSSTVASAAGAWNLTLYPDAIYPERNGNHYNGFSLRWQTSHQNNHPV